MTSILISLIPVGAALVGGFLGFAGAIIASGRATKAATKQARVSRLRERQYEVFATLNGQINVIFEIAHADLMNAQNNNEIINETIAVNKAIIELQRHSLRNKLWIPDYIDTAARAFAVALYRRKAEFVSESDRGIQIDDSEYQQEKRFSIRAWKPRASI